MYYSINLEWNPKVTGVKNGIYQVELDKESYDKKKYEELYSLFIGNEFTAHQVYPEVDFKFNFKKLKNAKKTTFLSYSPNLKHGQFLIKKETLDQLSEYNLQRHKAYESVVYDSLSQSFDESYYLFYTVLQDWNVIDFNKTIFISGGFGNNPISEHKFFDETEMKNFNGIAKVKTLALKDFDTSLDFFLTRIGGSFVSERLKNALEQSKVSGIIFSDEIDVLV